MNTETHNQLQLELSATSADGPVSLSFPADTARFNLRVGQSNVEAASKALGFNLPTNIGDIAESGGRRALCLGPDEWVLHGDETDRSNMVEAFASIYEKAPHSLVDVSDREITISLSGDEVCTLLAVACPIDLRDLPVGTGKRTIFDCAQIVLHRDGEEHFRMEVARSFTVHVWGLLNIANAELATGL